MISPKLKNSIPVFRIFDVAKAKEFYLNFLGFEVDWEHKFEEDLPLYMQISHGSCKIHLSENHGDACPGSSVRIEVENLSSFHENLWAKQYKFARPGMESTPWDTREVRVGDPFGNRIIFYEFIK
ncbi:glyoxalase superfamily protein [Alteribacillus sp. HJP-4]|uniref:glyoxalase superfamily protein n=1 Tax=Alteribacillus sp. HJP-4 TaxID=2775394 RepID=UPI0035CD311B